MTADEAENPVRSPKRRDKKKTLLAILGALFLLGSLLVVLLFATTLQPDQVEEVAVICPADAPRLEAGQPVEVMSWNVQYMASKNYVFWYDLLDGSGPDTRPSAEHITWTLQEVARVIKAERPDVILLQEVNDGAKRTDHADQLAQLIELLPSEYCCHASAFYWQAVFVPHPKVWGRAGMKLSTISRYAIDQALRHQLPLPPKFFVERHLSHKRAVLEVRLPRDGAQPLAVLNTHLDAWAQGTDTMRRQVEHIAARLGELDQQKIPWVIGGDFNLLPPGPAYQRLTKAEQAYYAPSSEVSTLYERYTAVPSQAEADGVQHQSWYTHFPNRPGAGGPDRTIDYLFSGPNVTLGEHHVRQSDTLEISDHLPVVAQYTPL